MSKFKVGDKVWCNGDVKIIKRVDEWEDGEYGYYFNVDDELLNFWEEDDLELYKTPHERLLELGWEFWEYLKYKNYEKFDENSRRTMSIRIFNDEYGIYYFLNNFTYVDLQLAEVLVDYLKELENE